VAFCRQTNGGQFTAFLRLVSASACQSKSTQHDVDSQALCSISLLFICAFFTQMMLIIIITTVIVVTLCSLGSKCRKIESHTS